MLRTLIWCLSVVANCAVLQSSSCGQERQPPGSPAGAWTISADALWLRRDFGTRTVLAELQPVVVPPQTPTAPPLRILTSSLNFHYAPGLRLQLARPLDATDSLQLRYFGLQDLDSGIQRLHNPTTPNTPPSQSRQLFSTGLIDVFRADSGDRVTAFQSTEIHSAEFNLRRNLFCGATSILAGVRYFRVEDELNLLGVATTATSEHTRARASNNLVGFQFGATRSACFHGMSLAASGKAGAFLNFDSQSVVSVDSTPSTVASIAGDDVTLSSALDLDFTASYFVTNALSLRGGYQAVLLSSLAMGPDQIALLGDAAGSTVGGFIDPDVGTSDASTVLFHGFFAGLELTW